MGTFLLLAPTLIVALTLALAAAVILLTRFVSLAVLTAAAVGGVAILILVIVGYLEPVYTLYLLVAYMIFWRHRRNIYSLIQGTERRLGERV
jgi:glycerol-3-phosphate acyltransferase PlsY